MDAERQQGGFYQRLLFEEWTESPRHGEGSEGGTRPSPREEQQAFAATGPARALTEHLMEEVADRENLNRAYRRVKANQGAPGVDGMTIAAARDWIIAHKEELIAALLDGSYQPRPVRGVQIPKPGGGMRQSRAPAPPVMSALVHFVALTAPLFALIALGFGLARSGRWPTAATDALTRFVFSIAIPALLFRLMSDFSKLPPVDAD